MALIWVRVLFAGIKGTDVLCMLVGGINTFLMGGKWPGCLPFCFGVLRFYELQLAGMLIIFFCVPVMVAINRPFVYFYRCMA